MNICLIACAVVWEESLLEELSNDTENKKLFALQPHLFTVATLIMQKMPLLVTLAVGVSFYCSLCRWKAIRKGF